MKDRLSEQELVQLILSLAQDMTAAKDQLTELDSAIGDGDLGVTVTLGFRAVRTALQSKVPPGPKNTLRLCGSAFAELAPSTFGTLLATAFMSAARVCEDGETIGPTEAAALFQAAVGGVQRRGKASLGDKTMLDAMIPAAGVFSTKAGQGHTLLECSAAALAAAREGADKTAAMLSQAGRSSWLGERAIGVKDPGAVAVVMMLDSINNYLSTVTTADC